MVHVVYYGLAQILDPERTYQKTMELYFPFSAMLVKIQRCTVQYP